MLLSWLCLRCGSVGTTRNGVTLSVAAPNVGPSSLATAIAALGAARSRFTHSCAP